MVQKGCLIYSSVQYPLQGNQETEEISTIKELFWLFAICTTASAKHATHFKFEAALYLRSSQINQ